MALDYEKLCQWHLFHRLWSTTVGTANYDKRAWMAMDKFIPRRENCGCETVYAAEKKDG